MDGAGTFHGMGIIGAATPGTKHRKAIHREVTTTLETVSCTMGKVFIRYFDASVVDLSLAYEAVLQNFTAEDKSKILYIPWKVSSPLSRLVSDDAECVRRDISWSEYFDFLPIIDMDPTNIAAYFYTHLWHYAMEPHQFSSLTCPVVKSHGGRWLPSPEQFEDIFLQMLSLMLNSIKRE